MDEENTFEEWFDEYVDTMHAISSLERQECEEFANGHIIQLVDLYNLGFEPDEAAFDLYLAYEKV